jgi:hypothetical protein
MTQLPQAPFSQPDFIAVMQALLQPIVDQQNVTNALPNLYNLDVAVGSQLDTTGQWIGPTRVVQVPPTGIFFSFDTTGLGFDQGAWAPVGVGGTNTVAYELPDDEYRLLLYATVAANHWDGTVPGGEAVLNQFWNPLGYSEYIIDHQDMTIAFLLIGPVPNAVTGTLYKGGYLDVVAAGVGVTAHYFAQGSGGIPFAPLFGFDIEDAVIQGFDQGSWASEQFVISPAVFMSGAIRENHDRIIGKSYLPAASTLSGTIRELSDRVTSFGPKITATVAVTEGNDIVVSFSTGSQQITGSSAIHESSDTVAAAGSHIATGSSAILERADRDAAVATVSSVGAAPILESADLPAATATVT